MKKTLVLIAALAAPWAEATYKCLDDKGVTHIGDTPPPGCANVVMYELSPSGKVLRKIDPTPTEEQLRARQEEFERAKAAIRQQDDRKRADMALINTFSTEKEFDVVRDRNIEPLRSRINMAQERMKAIDKRKKELEEELEFYKAGKSKTKTKEPPPQLTGDLVRLSTERNHLETSIANSEKEIESLKVKFDADKRRWVTLKGGAKPGDSAAETTPAAAKPAESAPPAGKSVKKN
jgi:uncharacterized protein DUF4124